MRLVSLALTAILTTSLAQDPQRSAREARGSTPGTATISGVVISDDRDETAVRHARVTCSAAELHGDLMTVTDDRGRFTFASLPAGRYTILETGPLSNIAAALRLANTAHQQVHGSPSENWN